MNRTHRYSRASILLALILPIVASACIVVVEEDDRDRRRHLHGSEWYLEVVFYRTQTIEADDRTVSVDFAEDGLISGNAGCGPFTGFYTVNDNGGLDIESIDLNENCGGQSAAELLVDGLRSARAYEIDGNSLRIDTEQDGYLSFTAE